MALSRMRTCSSVVTFSPFNALRIVTSLTLWMFLNRLRMLSSTNIFFSLLIFPSHLILVVWGDGIEPPLVLVALSDHRCKYRPTLPYQILPIPARKSDVDQPFIYMLTPTASLFPSLITEWQEAESNRPPSEAFTLHVTLSRAYLPFLL